jgi:uncharacterized Zn finger protein
MNITQAQICELFEPRYMERGWSYMSSGIVVLTDIQPDRVNATCGGTRLYEITLTLTHGKLSGHCTCPAVDDFGPCKHMAATAFAVIEQAGHRYSPNRAFVERIEGSHRMKRRLMQLSKPNLVDLVIQLVHDEQGLNELLGDDD